MFPLPQSMCEIHSIGARTKERIIGSWMVPLLKEFGIAMTGVSEAEEGFYFCRLHPKDVQILAVMSGQGEVLVNGKWEKMGTGCAYLTPPDAPNAYRATADCPWTVCWVIYNPVNLREAGYLSPNTPVVIPFDTPPLWHAIEGACAAAATQNNLLELWVRLIHQTALHNLNARESAPRLAAVWSAVNANLSRDWTLDELARIAAMSKENLRRVCLRELGISPMRQLTRLRVNRATEWLSCSSDKLASIAERVGYGDPFAFSAAFKRETGKRPSAYRR